MCRTTVATFIFSFAVAEVGGFFFFFTIPVIKTILFFHFVFPKRPQGCNLWHSFSFGEFIYIYIASIRSIRISNTLALMHE